MTTEQLGIAENETMEVEGSSSLPAGGVLKGLAAAAALAFAPMAASAQGNNKNRNKSNKAQGANHKNHAQGGGKGKHANAAGDSSATASAAAAPAKKCNKVGPTGPTGPTGAAGPTNTSPFDNFTYFQCNVGTSFAGSNDRIPGGSCGADYPVGGSVFDDNFFFLTPGLTVREESVDAFFYYAGIHNTTVNNFNIEVCTTCIPT